MAEYIRVIANIVSIVFVTYGIFVLRKWKKVADKLNDLTYSATDVARYIILRCNQRGKTISNLKLQKILYFVQAEFLVSQGKPCFRERIEAWDFGPVIPDVYHRYKVYGSASIPSVRDENYCPFDREDKALADGIIDECAKYSASTLVEITHRQAPWRTAYHQYSGAVISNESIKSFFQEG